MTVRTEATWRLAARLVKARGKKIKAWRVVRPGEQNSRVESIFFPHVWRAGWNDSGRESNWGKCKLAECEKVYRGFHVFLSEAAAEGIRHPGEVILEVTCHAEDLVAAGSSDMAVFRKVYVTRAALRAAVKAAKDGAKWVWPATSR